ncbi:hypothetical protein GCM10022224_104190 [Nonomuraea antimicrobica]|uniref:Uncharacterized protein n=1 Tax=Nonomuraea antimicrobica TaxID=561173 RepID=A0ABP7EQ89_9ACTN
MVANPALQPRQPPGTGPNRAARPWDGAAGEPVPWPPIIPGGQSLNAEETMPPPIPPDGGFYGSVPSGPLTPRWRWVARLCAWFDGCSADSTRRGNGVKPAGCSSAINRAMRSGSLHGAADSQPRRL